MHSCKETQAQLTELLLDGSDVRSQKALAGQLDHCGECRAEFEALSVTLRTTRRLRETPAPAESYWSGYHAQLRERLVHASEDSHAKAPKRQEKPASVFAPLRLCGKLLLFPVRVPLGVAAVLAVSVLALFAFQTSRKPIDRVQIVNVPVEVPVVTEKTITRVVYRDRPQLAKVSRRRPAGPPAESTFARSQKPQHEELPASLTGFKPTEEIKLTVIKGGSPNEK